MARSALLLILRSTCSIVPLLDNCGTSFEWGVFFLSFVFCTMGEASRESEMGERDGWEKHDTNGIIRYKME